MPEWSKAVEIGDFSTRRPHLELPLGSERLRRASRVRGAAQARGRAPRAIQVASCSTRMRGGTLTFDRAAAPKAMVPATVSNVGVSEADTVTSPASSFSSPAPESSLMSLPGRPKADKWALA